VVRRGATPSLTRDYQEATGRQRPRVWWCVTGQLSFLPIHAARNTQDNHRVCTSDYVVSSFVPTLSALIKAREGWRSVTRTEMTSVLIGETASGERFLPSVEDEVKAVKGCFDAAAVQVLKLSSPHTQVKELHAALGEQDMRVLHLCCHGVQKADPLKSSFLLSNGSLTIEDIMKFNLPNAVLAFLSACQTAQGSWSQPDQAVHLAASMLFCGFRSVVGTMWLVSLSAAFEQAQH
jgi:CHAT domain-containing protein